MWYKNISECKNISVTIYTIGNYLLCQYGLMKDEIGLFVGKFSNIKSQHTNYK